MDKLQIYYTCVQVANLIYIAYIFTQDIKQGLILLTLTAAFTAPAAGRIFGVW